ncbi:Di-sulfide bridge nucleocytoplasmic transport domain-containing protein [Xylariales sp. PMI_506]|nr:Di-sulfide bridge nucleocytoplasmic transport domain-containing protein [Xylariales sp. PMI_506]
MDRRTFESPMDWEYQTQGPMDPTSPFVTAQKNNIFAQTRGGAFGSRPQGNIFGGSASTTNSPQKPAAQGPSMFHRVNTAPAFRNPAFTTPRKPFDMDVMSEASAAEDSPAPTDISEGGPDTPDDHARNFGQMTLTPARSRTTSAILKRSPGKGEIPRGSMATFGNRDKVRKRKRKHDDKDISGFRLPYKQLEEWDDSEGNDSDDSTYQPNEHHRPPKATRKSKGWFSGFLSAIQKNPAAPILLGYWIQLMFNLIIVGVVLWILWIIMAGFRDDFWAAREELRNAVVTEMSECAKHYTTNRCSPVEQRLPAMVAMCEEWEACMNQNPDRVRRVQLGAKNIVEIINSIFETMHWKTLAVFFLLFAMLCFSGASLFKSSPAAFAPMATHPHQPQTSQPALHHSQYMYGQVPQTPSTRFHGLLQNDETPDTDASPADYKALPPPLPYQTPSSRRSPSKGERDRERGRERSPTKSRSPVKRY